MFGDVAGAFEVPGIANDEGGVEALLLHYFVCFGNIFLGGLRVFFDMNLVREDSVF